MAISSATVSMQEFLDLKANITALKSILEGQPVSSINSGDTAWMLTSSAFVLLMTLPGLALFYGGMSQAKNVLSTVFQTYSIACLITILWIAVTYSVCFYSVSPVLGGADRLWLIGTKDTGNQKSPYRLGPNSVHPLAPTIPESVFMVFQLTFAIITPALVCGSLAERMKFEAVLIFIFLWHFAVYCPACHSEWGPGGFLAAAGDLDFAGGNVVHISSGFSGLAASIVLGPRRGFRVLSLRPHNIIYSVIGGSLLWVGWFGFNAGSATTAGTSAGFAFLVTHVCGATGGFVWMLVEYAHKGKPSVIGIVSGTICGLVVITPASGYVDHTAAVSMALISTPVVYFGLQLKERVGYDDALDAFGVHGVGGVCGSLLTGFFANDFISGSPEKRGVFYGKSDQIWIQLYGLVVIASWSFVMSYLILVCIKYTMGLRVTDEEEELGLDITQHGESMSHEGDQEPHRIFRTDPVHADKLLRIPLQDQKQNSGDCFESASSSAAGVGKDAHGNGFAHGQAPIPSSAALPSAKAQCKVSPLPGQVEDGFGQVEDGGVPVAIDAVHPVSPRDGGDVDLGPSRGPRSNGAASPLPRDGKGS